MRTATPKSQQDTPLGSHRTDKPLTLSAEQQRDFEEAKENVDKGGYPGFKAMFAKFGIPHKPKK